jgi:hypothetical protein
MTVGDWLASRTPPPPPALRDRLAAVIGASAASDDLGTADICLTAAERLLNDLLRGDCTSRDTALDLLAADALVTYAFEAACETSGEFDGLAHAAMQRFAALGVAHGSAPPPPAPE